MEKKSFLDWLVGMVPGYKPRKLIPEATTYNQFLEQINSFFGDLPYGDGQKLYVLINLKEDGPKPKRPGTVTAQSLVLDIIKSQKEGNLNVYESLDLKMNIREMVKQAWAYYYDLKARKTKAQGKEQMSLFQEGE